MVEDPLVTFKLTFWTNVVGKSKFMIASHSVRERERERRGCIVCFAVCLQDRLVNMPILYFSRFAVSKHITWNK